LTTEPSPQRPAWVGIALALLPLWLIASAGVAIYLSITRESNETAETQQRFMQEMSVERIADDLHKLTGVIGERNLSSESSRQNLSRAASMIEGILGPQNTGYAIDRIAGPAQWPILRAKLPGSSQNAPALWVVTTYDTPINPAPTSSASSGIAATIAAAQAMARDELQVEIHFIFLPHGNDPESPISETITKLKALGNAPQMVFHIDAMDRSGQLLAFTADPEATLLKSIGELGSLHALESNQATLADSLLKAGFKSVRITTQTNPDLEPLPPAEHIAIATGRLIEWLRRCSNLSALD